MLDKIRVLDLTRVLAGPWCTQILAEFGAEVIKIEAPDGGDESRIVPPFFHPEAPGDLSRSRERSEWSAFYVTTNRGKKSVVLDISTPEGQAALRRLAASADVLVENFKVGNLARYGLDAVSLRALYPRLIYCSITGYGQTGPWAAQPGYDAMFQAMSGLMSSCGRPDAEPGGGPIRTVVPYTDLMTGLYACVGILAALRHRDATGEGQTIDLALMDTAVAANCYVAGSYLATGQDVPRVGNAGIVAAPSGVYRCADGAVMMQTNVRNWPTFCRLLNREYWVDDTRFATLPDRLKHVKQLNAEVEQVTSGYHRAELVALLVGAGIPCTPINAISEALAEPQVQHRGVLRTMPLPEGGELPFLANPLRFSSITLKTAAPPRLGAHTAEYLGEAAASMAASAASRT